LASNKINGDLSNLPNQLEILDIEFDKFYGESLYFSNTKLKSLRLNYHYYIPHHTYDLLDENEFIKKIPKNIEELYLHNFSGFNICIDKILSSFNNLKILRLPEKYKFDNLEFLNNHLKKIITPSNIKIIYDKKNFNPNNNIVIIEYINNIKF
jgi:hypothetical protein